MAGKADIRAGEAYVSIYADQTRLERGLAKAQARLRAFGAAVRQYGQSLLMASMVVLAPTAYGMKLLVSYDDQMRELRAVTRAASKDAAGMKAEFDALDRTVRRLGRSTSYTATQVAEGATELGRAGFYPSEIDDTIEAVLNLGKASRTELGPAATMMADTLRAFKLPTTEASNVADVLLTTTTNSTQGMADLAEAMKYAAPAAKAAGASVKETAAAIGVLANVGIKGSMAGTSLRMAYINLVQPEVVKRVQELGVSTADVTGNLRPVSAIIADIGRATAKLGSAKRLEIFSQIFGARGMGAALELAQPGVYEAFIQQLDRIAGAAAKASAEMESGPGGAWRRFLSAAESAFLSLGKSVEGTFGSMMKWLTDMAGKIDTWIQQNRGLVNSIVKIAAIVAGAGVALIGLGLALQVAAFAVGTLKVAVMALLAPLKMIWMVGSALVSVFAFMVTPAGLVAVFIAAIGAVMLTTSEIGQEFCASMGRSFRAMGEAFGKTWKGIVDALMAGDLALAGKVALAGLKVVWLAGILPLRELWETLTTGIVEAWAWAGFALAKAWEDLKYVWAVTTNTMWKAFRSFGFLVGDFFWGIVKDVLSAVETMATKVGKLLSNKAMFVINPGLYFAGKQLVKFGESGASEFVAGKQDALAKGYLDAMDAADAKLAAKRASYLNALGALDQAEQASSVARWAESDAKLQGLRQDLEAAKKELDAAAQEAAKAREIAAAGGEVSGFAWPGGEWSPPKPENKPTGPHLPTMDGIMGQIRNATAKGAFEVTMGSLLSLRTGGGATDAATQTANNTKRTADQVDELNGKLDRALTFG